ncbi:MAG: tRNA pseudouridine synthase B [Candidatus Woesebacteria bacterium GW2011_GWB1_38_5]|uniref:tRNA pseudouridine synthase B n=2 Tax=Candidatus Woeseibacteriota TaxID=1752722 RepID=A0A0G0MNV5_9BACT|nr:MAG: tRNA pseudouridine synthase B [Candidatus Woesebacteria bacterium GW2011_GWB1_38_5]KKQ83347.1 MAG: tRNA pseudouridine synthase B [Candidatus Woesebacteria bacterium GW2011_GWA1_38_8]
MFLLIDKPKGITSHDVIDRIRKITDIRRTGHAGTLDPNATGLLIVGVGRESTKELWTKFGKMDKTYVAEITLGEERETDDSVGKIRNSNIEIRNGSAKLTILSSSMDKSQFSKSQMLKTLNLFLGEQMQTPPVYSAIKSGGKKAYEEARKGKVLKVEPRKVIIYSIKLLEYEYPLLKIESKVSSGTYIRALARDIGRKLGCGAYLSNLRRIKIGEYKVENSVKLDELTEDNLDRKFNVL